MSHVVNINGMNARRTTQVAHGLVTGEASRLRVVRYSHPSRTCASRYRVGVALDVRSQGVQRRERPFMLQPMRALALRAVCYVRLLTKGIAICVVAFLASHPCLLYTSPSPRDGLLS